MSRSEITSALKQIFNGIARLQAAFPHRAFTIDGRLVGDVGEVIAAIEYEIELDSVQRARHDGCTPDGRDVQIKATFKKHLTIRSIPDYYLGFQLFPDGNFEEIYNGPGSLIAARFANRKGLGLSLLSFPVHALKELSQSVQPGDRIRRRATTR
jgi:hypothetical protein